METYESSTWTVETYDEGLELFYDKGWTDGFPVVLPTKEKTAELLEFANLAPDDIIGKIPERNRVITAEKAAINSVMAGCKPEYFPVVIAAVKGVASPEFEFNHLASMGSPTPALIISGSIVRQLDLNHGSWLFGPGPRANATIGRALSLILWNCAELRPTEIQRGTYGNPLRWNSGLIAEDPETAEGDSLREYLGYGVDDNTVTVFSNCGTFTQPWVMKPDPVETLQALSDALVGGSGNFNRGVYVILMAPPIVERFHRAGWSREDVRNWLKQNSGRSLADLKKRGFPPAGEAHTLWASDEGIQSDGGFRENLIAGTTTAEDHEQFIYLFKPNDGFDNLIWSESQLTRDNDIYIVTAGGDASYGCIVMSEYDVSTVPSTFPIRSHFD